MGIAHDSFGRRIGCRYVIHCGAFITKKKTSAQQPGTGKTTVLNMLAAEYGLEIRRVCLGEMAARYDGKLGIGLERVTWQSGSKTLVVIEDIDLFCPKRGEAQDTGFLQSLYRVVHDTRLLLVSLDSRGFFLPL
ncbi:hypothetical protein BJV82DRAFT_379654 [Fennellomyces sp. T-0311]|nr:hypothetical protein BJV82DRAFT_379654 [Fennellomyces sp. T-0311]